MLSEKGQVIVEYLLILLVVATVAFGVYTRIKEIIKEDGGGSYLSPFSVLDTEDPKKRYKNFIIIR